MSGKPRLRLATVVLAVALLGASCLGPNHATANLAKWNSDIDGKWGNEVAFVLLLPVYALFSAGDLLIFNPWQWWTGENPINLPKSGEPGPAF